MDKDSSFSSVLEDERRLSDHKHIPNMSIPPQQDFRHDYLYEIGADYCTSLAYSDVVWNGKVFPGEFPFNYHDTRSLPEDATIIGKADNNTNEEMKVVDPSSGEAERRIEEEEADRQLMLSLLEDYHRLTKRKQEHHDDLLGSCVETNDLIIQFHVQNAPDDNTDDEEWEDDE